MKMEDSGTRHMDAEEIESYSLGCLAAEEAAPFDEHLLICEKCQAMVEACDAYVAAMHGAALRIRQGAGVVKPARKPSARASSASAC